MISKVKNYSTAQFREDYKDNLFNYKWMEDNNGVIRSFFPEIWTDITHLSIPYIEFALNAMGVRWSNIQQFIAIMVHFESCNLIERSNKMIRRSVMPVDLEKIR